MKFKRASRALTKIQNGEGVIAIDCDVTFFDIAHKWFEWLENHYQMLYSEKYEINLKNKLVEYNLSTYFDILDDSNPLDFFDLDDTYKKCPYHNNAVKIIRKLIELGNTIVFVSYCNDSQAHAQNKINRLLEIFPELDGQFHFVATTDKSIVNCDMIIDDRHGYLNQSAAPIKVKYEAHFTQNVQLDKLGSLNLTIEDWSELDELLLTEES